MKHLGQSLYRMDIYSPHGTKVILDAPENGYPHHQETLKKAGLVVGRVYTVNFTEVHDCYTDVYLVEVPNVAFNSVNFGDLTTIPN